MTTKFDNLTTRAADTLDVEKLRAIYAYWNTLRGDRPMPPRAEFDPTHIPRLLSDLCLMEVIRDAGQMRFLYRVAGTALTEFVGQDFTNRYLDELWGAEEYAKIMEFYPAAAVVGRPVYSSFRLTYPHLDYPKIMKRLMLPMTGVGDSIDFLLNMQAYEGNSRDTRGFDMVENFTLLELFIVDQTGSES